MVRNRRKKIVECEGVQFIFASSDNGPNETAIIKAQFLLNVSVKAKVQHPPGI